MSFHLKPGRSVASEVRRIADQQLAQAIEELRTIGDRRSEDRVHEARRHVKKVRALLSLVRPALGDSAHPLNRRLRTANRLLGPIADGRGVVATVAQLGGRIHTRQAQRGLGSLHRALVRRARRIDRRAQRDRVLPIVAEVLRHERQRVARLTLNARGFDAVGKGLERCRRLALKAMKRSLRCLAADDYHAWRRRVKELWFQVRLIEARCDDTSIGDQRRLEALDGCLGEYRNVILLEEILITESLLPRQQAAECLRLLRRYQAELRSRAASIGRQVFDERPGHFIRRIERLWRTPGAGAAAARGHRWQRAA